MGKIIRRFRRELVAAGFIPVPAPPIFPDDPREGLDIPVSSKDGPNGKGEVIRLNADVDVETYKRMKHALVEDRLTFATWLRQSIEAYIATKEPKGKRKGKGA